MLTSIREKSQGWLTWTIAILITIAFGMWGVQYYLQRDSTPTPLATVNGQDITQRDFNKVYERIRNVWLERLGGQATINQAQDNRIKRAAMDELLNITVLQQAAHTMGLRIANQEVIATVRSFPAFHIDGRFSSERFRQFLANSSYSDTEFVDAIERDLLINQLRDGFVLSAFVLPYEETATIELVQQQRDIGYSIVPFARFEKIVKINDEQIKHYYQTHRKGFTTPEQVRIAYIKLDVDEITNKIKFTDEELKQYYERHLASYSTPGSWEIAHILVGVPPKAQANVETSAKLKADKIYQQLQQGANFATLAKQDSSDVLTAR